MTEKLKDFSIGIEEELFLVEAKSKNLIKRWPPSFQKICSRDYPKSIEHEFLCAQLEIITPPTNDLLTLRKSLKSLRAFCHQQASKNNIELMISSTHPTCLWQEAVQTEHPRYKRLQQLLKNSSNRMLVSGMHVHIGLSSQEKRLILLNTITPYLPLILALSASSPFWEGSDSGHASYRNSVILGLPRSGFPPLFKTMAEYKQYISCLVNSKVIENSREIWWDARLSERYPTVEIRIADVCANHHDSLAISAFILCLSHYLLTIEQPKVSKSIAEQVALYQENCWQAKRFGCKKGVFIDGFSNTSLTIEEYVTSLIEKLLPHAKYFSCQAELEHCKTILKEGSSADKQRKIFERELLEHGDKQKALAGVKSFLTKESLLGIC